MTVNLYVTGCQRRAGPGVTGTVTPSLQRPLVGPAQASLTLRHPSRPGRDRPLGRQKPLVTACCAGGPGRPGPEMHVEPMRFAKIERKSKIPVVF